MAITKSTPTQIGTTTGLGTGGASYTSNAFDVSTAAMAEIELVLSYTTAPTTGTVDIEVYDSLDGTNFADEAIYAGSATPRSLAHRATFPIDVLASRNIVVKVINNTDQIVNVTINAITTAL